MSTHAHLNKLNNAYGDLMPALIRLALKVGENDADLLRAAKAADAINDLMSEMREAISPNT